MTSTAAERGVLGEQGHHHVEPSDLPRQLSPGVLGIWYLENLLAALVVTSIAAIFLWTPWASGRWEVVAWSVVVLVLVVCALEHLWLIPRRYARYAYEFSGDLLVIRHGAFVRKEMLFPLVHILYVETNQNLLLRRYGLYGVHLQTIGEPRRLGPVSAAEVIELRERVRRAHPGSDDRP